MAYNYSFLTTFDGQRNSFALRCDNFIQPEWHETRLEINIILKGTADVIISDQVYHLIPGDVFLVNPGEIHTVQGKSEVLLFSLQIPTRTTFMVQNDDLTDFEHILYPEEKEIVQSIFTAILRNTFAITCLNKKREEHLDQLLISFLPICGISQRKPHIDSKELKTLNQLLLYIHNYQDEYISLKRVAYDLHCSCGYLDTLFKENLGMTFMKYLNEVRLKAGLQMVFNTEKSCKSIASEVGFSNTYAFSREFKKRFGLSPDKYRKLKKIRPTMEPDYLFVRKISDFDTHRFGNDGNIIQDFINRHSSLMSFLPDFPITENHIFPVFPIVRRLIQADNETPLKKRIWLTEFLEKKEYFKESLESFRKTNLSLYISFEKDFRRVRVTDFQVMYDFSPLYKALDFLKKDFKNISVRLIFVFTKEKQDDIITKADNPGNLFVQCQDSITFIKRHYGRDMVYSWAFLTESTLDNIYSLKPEDDI